MGRSERELTSDTPARYLISDGLVEAGARVESSKWGSGQPRIEGALVAVDRGYAMVELDDGRILRRSAGHLRRRKMNEHELSQITD